MLYITPSLDLPQRDDIHPILHITDWETETWIQQLQLRVETWAPVCCSALACLEPHANIHFKYCTGQRFDQQISSPLKLSRHAKAYLHMVWVYTTATDCMQWLSAYLLTKSFILKEWFHKPLWKENKRTSTYIQSKLNFLLWTGLHAFFHVTLSQLYSFIRCRRNVFPVIRNTSLLEHMNDSLCRVSTIN